MPWRDSIDLFQQIEFDMHRFTEQALRSFLDGPGAHGRFWQPAADVHTTESGVVIKLELAGVSVDSMGVALSGDGRHLTVSGIRAESEEERSSRTGCQQLEIYVGPFERTFVLPADHGLQRDRISATLKEGFLTITLPRAAPVAETVRTIPISVESEERR